MMYRVKFKRPDGTEAWLGEAGCGSTDDEEKSPAIELVEAVQVAYERNRVHGPSGYEYFVVSIKEEVA